MILLNNIKIKNENLNQFKLKIIYSLMNRQDIIRSLFY